MIFTDALVGLIKRDASPAAAFWPFQLREMPMPVPTASGKNISPRTALSSGTVFRCITIIADAAAQLKCPLKRPAQDQGFEIAADHMAHKLINVRPNSEMTPYRFRKTLFTHMLAWGNSYSQVVMNDMRTNGEIWPLDPEKMKMKRASETAPMTYEYRFGNAGQYAPIPAEEVLHVPDFSIDGVKGISRITLAREGIALEISLQEYAARFFANDATPRGFLTSKAMIKQDAKDKLREEWEKANSGVNRHRVGILDAELDFKSISLPQEDAQYLQSRQFQVQEIARWFGVPLHKLGELSRSTNNNIEQQAQEFYGDCLQPILTNVEQLFSRMLLTQAELDLGYYFEFKVDDLLRTDIESQADADQKKIYCGVLSPNEARIRQGLNPYEGGDMRFMPLTNGPIGTGVLTPNEQRAKIDLEPLDGGDVLASAATQQQTNESEGDGAGEKTDDKAAETAPADDGKAATDKKKAAKKTAKKALKRAFLPVFRDVFDRIVSKETLKIENLLKKQARSSTAEDTRNAINMAYVEIAGNLKDALKPAVLAVADMSGGMELGQILTYLSESSNRHLVDPIFEFPAALRTEKPDDALINCRAILAKHLETRAANRAEQELDLLLEMISDE